jgi:1L-myo-inositol 1-phosphate cytidylyltransferase / CDP-L-myo-inositol myo-inositolphosphotransferase
MDAFAKETDGFFARHFDRKISGAVSRQLLKTPITPNQITIAVTLLGVFSGACMAQPGDGPKILGAFLFLATSILDGCDGEVARAKQMTSRLGGWLDLWGDNVVHIAVFYGLSVGLYRDTGIETYRALGLMAAAGTLASAALASYQTYRKSRRQKPSGESLFTSVVGDASHVRSAWQARLVRWSDALARRDFIYGVVILALISRLEWFLWACAIGVTVYTLVLTALFFLTPE